MRRGIPASRFSPSVRVAAVSVGVVLGAGLAAGGLAAPPEPHASPAATRLCLLELGVSVAVVPAKAAVGPEGDLSFVFPSGRRGQLSFFHTDAAARSRAALDARRVRISHLPVPYRVLNVEVRWAAKPGAPSATEKALLSRCIIRRGSPTPG